MREKDLGVRVTLRTFEDIVVEGGRGPVKAVRHSMEDADRCSFSHAPQAKLEWQPEYDKEVQCKRVADWSAWDKFFHQTAHSVPESLDSTQPPATLGQPKLRMTPVPPSVEKIL
ncbi:hypothetical protein MHYP_G00339360 [Metynnis hypsauchen]